MAPLKQLEVYENYYGCWIVASHKTQPNSYPEFCRNGKVWKIHRWMYQKYYGEIPEGILVCHTCDNKKCINPEHFFLGTHKDNTQDALKKDRMINFKGEANALSKLTEKKIKEIRRAEGRNIDIAIIYNISPSHCCNIRKGRSWKHIL